MLLRSTVCLLSVCCGLHLYTLLELFDGFRCYLVGILVRSNDGLC